MICELTVLNGKPNYCAKHERFHSGHLAAIAVDPSDFGEQYRNAWDRQASPPVSKLLRSLPLARQCIHLGTQNPPKKKDCGNCSTWNCDLHGEVQITRCTSECGDWKQALTVDNTTRHLLYHIYPVSGNGAWQWNVQQLCGRIKCFNGRKIIAVAIDPPSGRLPDPSGPNSPDTGRLISGCDSLQAVKDEFAKRTSEPIEFMEFENNPHLREVLTLIPMLSEVLTNDPRSLIFYGQAKGTTRRGGHIARRWTEALYEILLDHFPLAVEQLQAKPITGAFKKLGPGWSPTQSHSDWHYSGSWFWARAAALYERNWQKIDQFWSGIEPYPSQQFTQAESGCLFHEAQVPEMNLYARRYWRQAVLPQFDRWREENSKFRTNLWPK